MLQLQQACFENIKTLCTNFKKDSASRKTQDYLQKRLKSLISQWQDFEQRHAVLNEEYHDKNIHYFTDDVYTKTKTLYENTKAELENLLKQSKREDTSFDLAGMFSDVTEDKIKTLLTKQENNFKAISRAMSKVDLRTICEKWELEDHLGILKAKWEAVERLHWELEGELKDPDQYYAMFVSIEDRYDEIKRALNSKIWSTVHYQQSAPRIEVPDFSGNYHHWISFKDLFQETIHNNPSINKAQKMQHLKTKLKGEAHRLVQHLTVCAENYDSCWTILNQRYDNRRLQFSSYMNTMLNLPVIQNPDAYNMKKAHDVITECMNGLNNIGLDTSTWDPIIVHLMCQKLDSGSYNEYIKELQHQHHRELPNLNDFLFFLENKFMAYESMKNLKRTPNSTNAHKQSFSKSNQVPDKKQNDSKKINYYPKSYHTAHGNCPHCDESHVLMQCPKFIGMDASQRNSLITKLHVCKNCLYSHGNETCKSMKTCKECNLKHHTLLHMNKKTQSTNNSSGSRPNSYTNQAQSSNHLSTNEMEVLLTTVLLKIKAQNGTYVTLRALLDQGSQVNLITENAAQLLNLPRLKLNATISGVGAVTGDCKGRMQLSCKSIHSDFEFDTQVLILRKLTNNLPNTSFEKMNWPHLENLKLADPDFNQSRPIDLLLGADVYADIILDGVLRGTKQSPIAQQTQLGWILCGKLKTLNCYATSIDLNELTKFWEHEDITTSNKDISENDHCEQLYQNTVQRAADGKYIVKMPFCSNFENKLGNSRAIAVTQFLQLEKRLEKNKKLATLYRQFIQEYAYLGHMKPAVPVPTLSTSAQCYLPHHGVLRESSTTTKLRVVFNASQKTSSGLSLNSLQEKGPNLQKDIQALVLRWRSYRYAYTADIEKMYRCIWVSEEQQPLQKIIWRDSPNQRLQEYELCTITYGMKCAPWLAMRTLKQLAQDNEYQYPAAADVLRNEFYVDDLISGHNSLHEAKNVQRSLIDLLKTGGMNLRKWSSNNSTLLDTLSQDQISNQDLFDFKGDESMKTLGLGWHPRTDHFIINWKFEETPTPSRQLTKRRLLSEISKLYDPLGWMSPVTITAKLLFQKVWMNKVDWNENLPLCIQNEWLKLKSELPLIRNIKLNRWVGCTESKIELICFCDASERAYSSVVYSRVTNKHGSPTITLLAAKTRVAPLAQKLTLPRLELNGALLLSQLVEKCKQSLTGHEITIQAWCDSQVVLAWLQGETTKWEKYVANRVVKIKQVIQPEQWHYVKSELNPADCASRGITPTKLINFDLWWHGPTFIQTQGDIKNTNCYFTTTIGHENELVAALTSSLQIEEHFIYHLLIKCSSLTKIIRITAYAMRFIAIARNKRKSDTECSYLSVHELSTANNYIVKYVQQNEFELEYKQLMQNKPIPQKSNLYKLNPYLDDIGIMRVGGRLRNSNLSCDMKHPAIIPKRGRFTTLLILQAHVATLHGGPRLTLAFIRQKYWILGGNRATKDQLRLCVKCHRYKPNKSYQLMGDLPQQRATPSRPFTHTGVDFTGYVEVKLNKGRGVRTSKGYVAVFICMATKAVHIELVSDLSTETFIAAFQRLCARRGTPKHMYSDCGTNFIGASKLLRHEFNEYKQILSNEFFNEMSDNGVEWHFNAPAWPTAGGLWEAAVKSMKYHLHRVLGDQKLTYEEFTTLLAKIEACMNSRPLCPLTEDPEEFYNYLTPGHFLTGSPTMSLQLSDYCDVNSFDIRRRWQLTEHLAQQFWRTWSNEYLTQLQRRSKWNYPTKNIEKNDIVLLKEDNLPPGKWAMGRVLELHPGSDGLVRVTTIRTQTGTIKRPITKLARLPIDQENTEEDKRESNKSIKKSSCLSTMLFTTLITLCLFIPGSRATQLGNVGASLSSAHITPFEPQRPIYYDTLGKVQIIHNEWTLLMYYNLTDYWDGVKHIRSYVKNLEDLCDKTDPRYCRATLEQIYHEMDILNYYNNILLSPHTHLSEGKRKKRGLVNGVGSIANSLFGILDQNFADKYQDDIEAIQNNENYLLQLVKNQTSIVELENSALRKSEDNIKRQFKLLDDHMEQTKSNVAKINSEFEIIMATSYFTSASLTAYLLINNLKTVQETLFNTMTDVYKGHIDVHLVTPVNLIKQLEDISGRLPRSLSLPVNNIQEDIKNLYNLLYVKARVTSNYFLFEIHIPLISDEDYTLYRAFALPVRTGTGVTSLQLRSEIVAVNFKENTYISLTEQDLRECLQNKPDMFICNKNLPVFYLQNRNAPCEAKLLSHGTTLNCDVTRVQCKDAWDELHVPNSWLVICCDTCVFRTICENDVTSHTMTSSGVITMAQGCVLQSQDSTIYAHNQYSSSINMNYKINVPNLNTTVNKIINIDSPSNTTGLYLPENPEIEEIQRRLNFEKKRKLELPSKITVHDLHQYILCYTILGLLILISFIWIVRKRCSKRTVVIKELPKDKHNEDIELRTIRSRRGAFRRESPPLPPPPSPLPISEPQRPRKKVTHQADNVVFEFD